MSVFSKEHEPWLSARELSLLTRMDEKKIGLWSTPLPATDRATERKMVASGQKVTPRMPFVIMDEKRGKVYRLSDVSEWMQKYFGQGYGYGEFMEEGPRKGSE